MSENVIEIRGLEKAFNKFKLGPLDLTVPRGAIYGFVGRNGAGKTTTMDLMFGMGDADAGTITINGLDHRRDEVAFKQRVGYVNPDTSFMIWGTVGKAIRFVRGFYPNWDHAYCDELMAAFDLDAKDMIGTLSFGAKTKLSLLLALAHRPEVLILDEPTTGLDAISRKLVFEELLKSVQGGDRTVLISSHGLSDLERFADHVGFIRDGRLLLEGRMDEVVDRYRQVDLAAPNGLPVNGADGCHVIRQDGDRWRVLIDQSRGIWDQLSAGGAKELANAPVTLEEMFVGLMGEEEK
ncbi:MAG: ABC transporter ATP-binding protein [Limisphaerales bacterium]